MTLTRMIKRLEAIRARHGGGVHVKCYDGLIRHGYVTARSVQTVKQSKPFKTYVAIH